MRAYFYARDADVEVAISDIVDMLNSWGISGSNADAIRYAIRYTAEAHGLIPQGIGRVIDKAEVAKEDGHGSSKWDGRKNPAGGGKPRDGKTVGNAT